MEAPASWSAYVAACESACCVVGTDGNILAANGALAARVGCDPAQLQAEPLTSLLATGQPLPPQFEEVLRCGVQGVALASSYLDIPWRSGAVERVEVRVSPMYDAQSGSMRQILVSVMPTSAPFEASLMSKETLPLSGGDASMMDASSDTQKLSATPASATVEGLRNVAGPVQQLLDQESEAAPANPRQAATAWSVLFASVLQKSMFSCVLLARANGAVGTAAAATAVGGGAGAGAAGTSGGAGDAEAAAKASDPYSIWHVSRGLEDLLGVPAAGLLGRTATVLCAPTDAPAPLSEQSQELHHAIATRTNCLIETVLTTSSGAPLFCLAYVLPLHTGGARTGTTAVAFLDVHRSLPYMQRQMEARELGGCDLYTFVKFSLLNCLVTDPSGADPSPAKRNPIIFASAGFSSMCGAAPEEVIGRNCRFLQSPEFHEASIPPPKGEDREAVGHMAAALDARQESLTYLHNFRKDGSKFNNLLFMTPITLESSATGEAGVLFWVGVQHPVDDQADARAQLEQQRATAAEVSDADVTRLLRSCHEALQSLQLQELYSAYTSHVHRTAIVIHSPDPGGATCVCRLCEHLVLTEMLQGHTQICRIVSQCKTIVACADDTLAKVLCKLNAATNSSIMAGQSGSQASLVLELFRAFTSALLAVTAASPVLPELSSLPARLDELIAAAQPSATALMWGDIKAAGQRKLAALQHAALWTSELQQTTVARPGADPLSHGQAPCLADFQVVRQLQRGSHASVLQVKKVQTGDVFAMKVIDRQRGRSHRLATERKVLFSCNSPFVVTTYFAFEDSQRLYLVMECLCSDCKHLLQERGVIPEAQAVSLAADVVLALEHLHAVGICHRDLKPENLLLTADGRAKLADFGLSHVAAKGISDEELARDPSIVGTPFYMAPEAIQGRARGFEAACDWWSFGVILYEFLTGFPPFQGQKVAEIYRSILTLSCIAPIHKCSVSAEAADMVSRLLVLQPHHRLVGASRVTAHPFFRGVCWPKHANPGGEASEGPQHPSVLGSLDSIMGQGLPSSSGSQPRASAAQQHQGSAHRTGTGPPSSGSNGSHSTAVTGNGGGVARAVSSGSGVSDERGSNQDELSAASTHAAATLQLHLRPEATDAHIENLTGLNDKASAAASALTHRPTPEAPMVATQW